MLSFRVFAARPPRRSPDSISNLAPISHPLSPNSFHCHRSEKTPVNSNHCHTSKIAACNPCVCHTSEPPGGLHSTFQHPNISGSPTFKPAINPTFQRSIPSLFIFLRTLLHVFAYAQKSTPFVSSASALFTKKTGWGYSQRSNVQPSNLQTFPPSHCSQTPLVPQSPKARDFFTIRGNNSAPPGV